MASQLRKIFLLLVLCSVSLASPVFYPEEVSDDFFTVLPSYFKFSFEAADGPGSIAAVGGGSSASGVVQKENADKDKLGEKALVADDLKGVVPGGIAKSDEVDDSASDENDENSTEPVKKLLIRTFTDLHPKVALELINKTLSIANATDLEEAKKSGDAWSVVDTTTETTTEQDESTTVATVQETTTTGTTPEQKPEHTSSSSSTEASSTSSTASSTTDATTESSAQSTLPATSSSTTPSAESSTVTSSSSSSTSSSTEATSSTTELIKEKEIEEIEAEIEADPVILTQGV